MKANLSTQLNDHEYTLFRNLILERSGLFFPEKRRRDLEGGLLQAFSQTNCKDLDSYYHLLADNHTGGRIWEQLISELTVGETHFFRNRPQFEALREHILPELIARKQFSTRHLRIWSAGCATGEEPYSIAILLHELLPDLFQWHITILATDINREALQRARAGRYRAWSFREKGWELLQDRYFVQQGPEWELLGKVRDMVTFDYLNLVEDAYPSMANNTVAFDLILCRNVTIYFTPEITQRVVDRMYDALIEGGWLVVGHAEPSLTTYTRFQTRNFPGTVLYRRSDTPARLDLPPLETLTRRPVQPPVATAPPSAIILPSPPRPQITKPAPPEATTAPLDLCAKAEELIQKGQIEEALKQLHQVLENDLNCARACYLIGKIRADAGHWEEAQQWVQHALERDPLLVEAHFLLALIHGQRGHVEESIAGMKRVVYIDRNAVLGHFCLANLYREMGDPARAEKSLRNTIRLLQTLPEEEPIPWSDGMTAGRLLYVVLQQMQEE